MKGSYMCTQCGKSLASSQSLWNHKQICKGTTERKRLRDINESEKFDRPAFNSTYSDQQNTISKESDSYQAKRKRIQEFKL